MNNRVQLHLIGLSYTPLQNGAFALLLAAEGSTKRIPVIIGAPEAQSIAIAMEGITPPRPLTHDLFASFAHAFGVTLKNVFIYNFDDGIFSSEMTFENEEREVTIDSRTSDAIAIALRTGAPIYTTPEIISETGIEMKEAPASEFANTIGSDSEDESETMADKDYMAMSIEELHDALNEAVDSDDFEEAALIQQIIDMKENKE